MFISWRTYTAVSGTIEQRFDFQCAHCGAQAPAVVRTFGTGTGTALFGVGGDRAAAEARTCAQTAAYNNALRAFRNVACPQCRQLQPSILAHFDEVRAAADARLRRRWRAAAIASAVTLAVGAVPAVVDFGASSALAFVAVALSLFVGSLVFIANSPPAPAASFASSDDVWFWWTAHPYQPAWTKAPSLAFAPPPIPSNARARALGIVSALLALAGVIAAAATFAFTFRSLYVVDVAGRGAKVYVDGKDEGAITADAHADVPFRTFTLRTNRSYEVVVVDPLEGRRAFTLNDDHTNNGWLVAPDARRHDLCLVDAEIIYSSGGSTSVPDFSVLREGDVVPLVHRFAYDFHPPDSSITMDRNQHEERRRSLRGFVCSELEAEREVPYRTILSARGATARPR